MQVLLLLFALSSLHALGAFTGGGGNDTKSGHNYYDQTCPQSFPDTIVLVNATYAHDKGSCIMFTQRVTSKQWWLQKHFDFC
jgi:hypothetical protein